MKLYLPTCEFSFIVFLLFFSFSLTKSVVGQEKQLHRAYVKGSSDLLEKYFESYRTQITDCNKSNDTVRQVTNILQLLLDHYKDTLTDFPLTINNKANRDICYILINSEHRLIFTNTLDTATIIKNNIKSQLPGSQHFLDSLDRFINKAGGFSRSIVNLFYQVTGREVRGSSLIDCALAELNLGSCKLLSTERGITKSINRFVSVPNKRERSKRVLFLQKAINIYPTLYNDKWICQENIIIKNIVLDQDMHAAIVVFSLYNLGLESSFRKYKDKWYLVSSIIKQQV